MISFVLHSDGVGHCACVGGASENDAWLKITSPQRQQSITHQPTHPSLHLNTFSCLPKILHGELHQAKKKGWVQECQEMEVSNFTSLFKGAFLANDPET